MCAWPFGSARSDDGSLSHARLLDVWASRGSGVDGCGMACPTATRVVCSAPGVRFVVHQGFHGAVGQKIWYDWYRPDNRR